MSSADRPVTLNIFYEELGKLQAEVKRAFEAIQSNILLNVESVKDRVSKIEEENLNLKSRIELLDRNSRKKNLVVFGLGRLTEVAGICQKLSELLGITLQETDVSDWYYLGKTERSPLKIELSSSYIKGVVLSNSNKLKGSNIYITHDLTKQQLEENRALKRHLLIHRENSKNRCYIKGNKLYINSVGHTLEELEASESPQDLQQSSGGNDSAPTTPSQVTDVGVRILSEIKSKEEEITESSGNKEESKVGEDQQQSESGPILKNPRLQKDSNSTLAKPATVVPKNQMNLRNKSGK